MASERTTPRSRLLWLWCGLLIAAFVAVRAVDLGSTDDVRLVPDSRAFLTAAAAPLDSKALWAGPRAPFAPLVFRLVGTDPQRIAVLQGLTAMAAWVLLALVAGRAMSTARSRVAAVLVVLALGAAPWVLAWDHVVMAESLTLSLLALWVAAGIEAVRRPEAVAPMIAVAAAGAAFALIRDGSGVVVAPVGLVLAVLGVRVLRRSSGAGVVRVLTGLALVLAVAASAVSAGGGGRWLFPYLNVIAQRVLTDAERTEWFAARGMPVSPALAARAGGWAHSDGAAFYTDPRLEKFRHWVTADGRSTLVAYLATHPGWTLAAPVGDLPDAVWPDTSGYVPEGWTAPVSPPRPSPPLRTALAVIVLVGGIGLAARVSVSPVLRASPVAIVAAVSVVLALPQLVAVWHADALQAVRHLVPSIVMLQLGFLLLLVSEVDRAPHGEPASEDPA
jgi:hypothetical protein